MSQAHSDKVLFHCQCGAKLAIRAEAADRQVRCPKCGGSYPGPGAVPAALKCERSTTPAKSETSGKLVDDRIIVPCQCGSRLRAPATAIGKIVRCPKCEARLSVKRPESAPPKKSSIRIQKGITPPIAEALSSSAIDVLTSASGMDRVAPPAPLNREKCPNCDAFRRRDSLICQQCGHDFTKQSPAAPGKACPSCKVEYPAKTKICVACGVDLKTGRRLLTADAGNIDQVYVTAEGVIRWLSWLVWFGIYPVASEGFGTRKPYVVRVTAALTCLVSLVFFMAIIKGSDTGDSMIKAALWCGHRETVSEVKAAMLEELKSDHESEADIPKEDLEQIDADAAASVAEQNRFEPYQLFTYAFLHAGPMHLAGNMLFLMVLGSRVNALIGNIWTAVMYPVLAVAAGLAHMWASASEVLHPMIGASGAVMGLAGMYFILFPAHNVHMAVWARLGIMAGFRLSYRIFTMRGVWVVLFYISFDVLFTLLRARDGVAHWAHLGGFGVGAVLALLLLVARLVNARGGDLLSVVLGQRAAALVGKPR